MDVNSLNRSGSFSTSEVSSDVVNRNSRSDSSTIETTQQVARPPSLNADSARPIGKRAGLPGSLGAVVNKVKDFASNRLHKDSPTHSTQSPPRRNSLNLEDSLQWDTRAADLNGEIDRKSEQTVANDNNAVVTPPLGERGPERALKKSEVLKNKIAEKNVDDINESNIGELKKDVQNYIKALKQESKTRTLDLPDDDPALKLCRKLNMDEKFEGQFGKLIKEMKPVGVLHREQAATASQRVKKGVATLLTKTDAGTKLAKKIGQKRKEDRIAKSEHAARQPLNFPNSKSIINFLNPLADHFDKTQLMDLGDALGAINRIKFENKEEIFPILTKIQAQLNDLTNLTPSETAIVNRLKNLIEQHLPKPQ